VALDLTLCLIPTQIEALFAKAINNPAYAEWISSIPSIIKDPDRFDFQDEGLIQLKEDVAALKDFYRFTDDHYFYDVSRCSSTIDYLLNEHLRATHGSVPPSLLWEGGNKYPSITAGQGIPTSLYDKAQVESIFHLLVALKFSDLRVHYDYEKMQEAGVYKLTRPENLEALEETFYQIKDIFLLALAEDLLVFKEID